MCNAIGQYVHIVLMSDYQWLRFSEVKVYSGNVQEMSRFRGGSGEAPSSSSTITFGNIVNLLDLNGNYDETCTI